VWRDGTGIVERSYAGDMAGSWAWQEFFTEDPRSWVLAGGEPAARWLLLTHVMDRGQDDPDVIGVHAQVLADPGIRSLIDRLPDWEAGARFGGHDSPAFAPNLLTLLADSGVQAGDDPRIEALLDRMLDHQDPDGRFQSYAPVRGTDDPLWGCLLCDTHAITEVLLRFGRGDDPRVQRSLAVMRDDLADTAQGPAWPCRTDPTTGFRGPGRKHDFCPQVTLEALRVFHLVPEAQRPDRLADSVRVALDGWRERDSHRPYMFGHGKGFKTIKWPSTWYRVDSLLDAVARFPTVWEQSRGHRRAVAELAACLIAYNLDPAGRVTPRSAFRGFLDQSFGQKKQPSPFATARVLAVLHRVDGLAAQVREIDVLSLPSSLGGKGNAEPPS
jgi:hypothetical protein